MIKEKISVRKIAAATGILRHDVSAIINKGIGTPEDKKKVCEYLERTYEEIDKIEVLNFPLRHKLPESKDPPITEQRKIHLYEKAQQEHNKINANLEKDLNS